MIERETAMVLYNISDAQHSSDGAFLLVSLQRTQSDGMYLSFDNIIILQICILSAKQLNSEGQDFNWLHLLFVCMNKFIT